MVEPARALSGPLIVIEHWESVEPDFGRRHLAARGHDVRVVEPWRGQALPELTGEEAGVMLMGGPQYVTELDDAPYLRREMRFAERGNRGMAIVGVPRVGRCELHEQQADRQGPYRGR